MQGVGLEKLARSTKWRLLPVEEGRFVLIPLIAGQADLRVVIQLNESAAAIWNALVHAHSELELFERLSSEIWHEEGLPNNWREQVKNCLGELIDLGAIHYDG
jgi:hypothetical protein